jgi:antitoxin component YwqK of YwqJK toxin-antitoxin module
MLKNSSILLLFLIPILSCNEQTEKTMYDWSNEVRNHIIEYSSTKPDSSSFENLNDTIQWYTTFYKGAKLRRFALNSLSRDTLSSIFFSIDPMFAILKKRCELLKNESEEWLVYQEKFVGLHEHFYCNGKIKKRGLNYKKPIGKWVIFDEDGKVLDSIDYGNEDLLQKFKDIKMKSVK